MALAPESFCTKSPECLIALFDLRYQGAEERLRREQSGWCGNAHVEELSDDHFALIIRPGGAMRVAA